MGLHTDFVRLKRGATRINVKLKAQGETDINATGPAVDETARPPCCKKLDALGPGDMQVLAGSVPAAVPADIYKQILARLQPRGVPAVVDAEKSCWPGPWHTARFFGEAKPFRAGRDIRPAPAKRGGYAAAPPGCRRAGRKNVLVSMAGEGPCFWMNTGTFTGRTPRGTVQKFCGRG